MSKLTDFPNQLQHIYLSNVCNVTTIKEKSPKKASSPGFLTSDKDSRTKVVLARKLGKQGLGSTPGPKPCTIEKI